LAWARTSPDLDVVWDAGKAEGVGPSTDPGEEVALGVPPDVGRVDVFDAALIHVSGREMAFLDQFPEPCGCKRIDLIVEGDHVDPKNAGSFWPPAVQP
jgi:hypothetical protein